MALHPLRTRERVNLTHHQLRDKDLAVLLGALSLNPHLKKLDLSRAKIMGTAWARLRAAMAARLYYRLFSTTVAAEPLRGSKGRTGNALTKRFEGEAKVHHERGGTRGAGSGTEALLAAPAGAAWGGGLLLFGFCALPLDSRLALDLFFVLFMFCVGLGV